MTQPNWYLLGPLIALAPVIIFPLFWSFICLLLANFGGWAGLARQYSLQSQPPQIDLAWRSMWFGLCNYRNCVNMAATDAGLYLAVAIFFRPAHPPIFIPWNAIRSVADKKVFLATVTEVTVDASPRPVRIQFPPNVAERLNLAQRVAHKPPPPLPPASH